LFATLVLHLCARLARDGPFVAAANYPRRGHTLRRNGIGIRANILKDCD